MLFLTSKGIISGEKLKDDPFSKDLSSWTATGQVLDSWTATGHVQIPTLGHLLYGLSLEMIV